MEDDDLPSPNSAEQPRTSLEETFILSAAMPAAWRTVTTGINLAPQPDFYEPNSRLGSAISRRQSGASNASHLSNASLIRNNTTLPGQLSRRPSATNVSRAVFTILGWGW